jgi:hypothetical protein
MTEALPGRGIQELAEQKDSRILEAKFPWATFLGAGILFDHWGDDPNMTQLRHKLEKESSHPEFLRTETGMSYRLWIGE